MQSVRDVYTQATQISVYYKYEFFRIKFFSFSFKKTRLFSVVSNKNTL